MLVENRSAHGSAPPPADACRGSVIVLKTPESGPARFPLTKDLLIYAEGIGQEALACAGTLVSTPDLADVAIVRLQPSVTIPLPASQTGSPRPTHRLPTTEVERLCSIASEVPLIVDVTLNQSVIFPELASAASAVTVNFGATDAQWVRAAHQHLGAPHLLAVS